MFDLHGKRESSVAGIKNKEYKEALAKEIKSESHRALREIPRPLEKRRSWIC